jgi:GT2 family glycosyltransferase
MLISIIIPTRNRAVYIQQLIDDLNTQSIKNFELIIVDQSKNPKHLENCKHIISNTIGPCISRNLGVQESKGEILVFLDDDARVEANFIEEITLPIITNKVDAVAGAMCDINGNYLKEKQHYLLSRSENFIKVLTDNPDSDRSQVCISLPGACCAVKRQVFNKIGGFDESFDPTGAAEDRDMALNLFKNGYSIWYNHKAKLYHIGADSGGSRDVGSRSESIDIHSYWICKKYFSQELSNALKKTILRKYRRKTYKNALKYNGFRTRLMQYFRIKKQLNK